MCLRQNAMKTYVHTFSPLISRKYSQIASIKRACYMTKYLVEIFLSPPFVFYATTFSRKISLNLTVQWGVRTATFYQRSVSKNNDCHKMYLSKKVSNCEANTPFLNDFFTFSDVFSKKSKNIMYVAWMESISAAMHIIQYSCRPINTMEVRQKKSTTKRCFQIKCVMFMNGIQTSAKL